MNNLPRTLKISPRPLGVFALALSPPLVLAAILFARRGPQPSVIFLAMIPLVLYALIITVIYSQRITVRPDGIEIVSLYRFRRFIAFAKITRTEIQFSPGTGHPGFARIHTTDTDDSEITLRLKALVPEDAAWLCALTELKPVMIGRDISE